MTAELFQFPQASNDDFALFAIAYLAGDPPEVAKIKPKEHLVYVSDQMKSAYQDSRELTGLVLWLLLPGVLLLAGLAVWIARRSY